MRSEHKLARARRRRRRALTGAATCVGVVLGIATTAGLAAATPVAGPGASPITAAAPGTTFAAVVSGIEPLSTISAQARSTLDDARSSLADAAAVAAEAGGSGLDLGPAGESVDTTGLRDAVQRLEEAQLVPVFLLPALAEDAAEHTRAVDDRVVELRADLEAARAQKAAEEAAAEAQRQAEAAAAAEAQRQAEAAAALAAANTPQGAKATAQRMAAAEYGWGGDQFSCLNSLWEKESGWNYRAYNASSGATGIPQSLPGSKMASAGADWQTNATTQIAWGLQYIDAVYGTPCAAWGHSQSTDWY